MIRYRNGAYEVVVHVGRDPLTGKAKRVSRTLRMAEQKRIPKAVKDLETRTRLEVLGGEHGGQYHTVGELLDAWLAHSTPRLSPKTIHDYRFVCANYVKPHVGRVRLDKLTPARVDHLYGLLHDRGGKDGRPLKPASVWQAHAVLRRALSVGMRWKWIATNPAALADPPKVRKRELQLPDRSDLDKLMADANEDTRLLVALALGTGCRRGELCGLRWSDVDWKRAALSVQRAVVPVGWEAVVKEPKTGKGRVVAIGPNLIEMLKLRHKDLQRRGMADDGYVLTDALDASVPLHPDRASKRFAQLAKKHGVAVRFHDLRHAAATWALQAGIAPSDVAASLGHASTRLTLDTYGHSLADGMRRMGRVLDVPIQK